VSSEHIVQLFDARESLGEAVAAFLQEGVLPGAPLLVVAKPGNVEEISRGLRRLGVAVPDLLASGQLTVMDAPATLGAIARNGMPDSRLFDAHIGDAVARLAGGPAPLRIYGELVEILAEEGNFRGAEALEDMWNDLGTVVPFTLLCGYSSAHFAAPNAGSVLQHICARHSRVHQSHSDSLGNWLLDCRAPAAGAQ
jgi:hypothetical protein